MAGLHLPEARVHALERLAHRAQQLVDGRLAGLQVTARPLLELAELDARQLEEGAVVHVERAARQRLEGLAQPLLARLQHGHARAGEAALALELGLETCPDLPGLPGALARAQADHQPGRQDAHREAHPEPHSHRRPVHAARVPCLRPVFQAYSGPGGRTRTMVEKTIELTGTSTNSIEDAVGLAVARASATLKGIKPEVEIDRITAMVEDGGVTAWRVRVRVSFAVQEHMHE